MNAQKRNIIVISAAVLLLVGFLAFFIPHQITKARTCRVAFYGIPQELATALTEEIKSQRSENITFTYLDGNEPLPFAAASSYTLFFAWNGKAVQTLAKHSPMLPSAYLAQFPQQIASSVRTEDTARFVVPLLLDHVEIAYYTNYRKELHLALPGSYSELLEYLNESILRAELPLMAAGGNDSTLLDVVSIAASSLLSTEEYSALADELAKSKKKDELPKALCRVLDTLKEIQSEQLTHKMWFQATDNDVTNFMEWQKISAVLMRLSTHRTKPFVLIKHYDAEPFPFHDDGKTHPIIAPTLCAVLLNTKNDEEKIVRHLISPAVQEQLSLSTRLAPTTLRAPAADKQADDVRYWAASNAGGIQPPLAEAAFSDPERQTLLAAHIRDYLHK